MSLMAGFAVVAADIALGIYHKLNTIPFGVYGATRVGKTTLHNQLRTRGEVADIKKRTVGLQRATRKSVKIDGDARTLKTADIGGESKYWDLWKKDMRDRKVDYIIFVIDDRHLEQTYNLENQLAWSYLVDLVCDEKKIP